MKTTKHTIDFIMRLVFYSLPLVAITLQAISNIESGTTINVIFLFKDLVDDVLSLPFITNFWTWFNTNILNSTSSDLIIILFGWGFYLVYAEFCILFKNVLVFLFFWSNKLIERGLHVNE